MNDPVDGLHGPLLGPPASLNLNVRGMRPSATVAINEHSNALIAAGHTVYKLGLGQSPFPVPPSVVESLRQHAHRKEYLPVRGLPELRSAVAEFHRRRAGLQATYSADDVLVAPGSKELMFIVQLAFYGDLLLPSPSWVSYSPQARIIGRQVNFLPTTLADRWMLRPATLDAHCRHDRGRPRILILNYPSNPTGQSFSRDELAALAAVAREHQLIVISDEIYGELHHAGAHASIAEFYPEGTILSAGLSKWCGAGGWRLGTFLFPPQLRWLRDAMTAVASETYTTTSAPIQCAAVTAFACGPDIDQYLRRARDVLRALGSWSSERLASAGARCHRPEGGFYLFPDFSDHAPRLQARGIRDGDALCQRLLADTGVAILPGSDFGRPAGDWTARLAYVDFDGERALAEHARDPAAPLDEAWLRRVTPRVTTAIDRMCDWLAA
jgi:aspartate aminotransferase